MDYGHDIDVVGVGMAVALTDLDELEATLDALGKAITLLERIRALSDSNTVMGVQLEKSADHMTWAIRRLAKKAWRYCCHLQREIE